jgi:hypothetical protein
MGSIMEDLRSFSKERKIFKKEKFLRKKIIQMSRKAYGN